MTENILTIKVIYDDRSMIFELLAKALSEISKGENEGFYGKDNCQISFQTEKLESEIERIKKTLLVNKSIFSEGNVGTIDKKQCILLPSKFH